MSGGGKGGSQTQTTQMAIPQYLEQPIRRNIARAEDISRIGFVPYMGPDVAALTPMQEAAMQSTGLAAQAFNLPNALGNQVTPEPQEFAGGMRGYSAFPIYEQALADLKESRPGQYDAIMNQFIDPFTGRPSAGAAPDYDLGTLEGRMAAGLIQEQGGLFGPTGGRKTYVDTLTGQEYRQGYTGGLTPIDRRQELIDNKA